MLLTTFPGGLLKPFNDPFQFHAARRAARLEYKMGSCWTASMQTPASDECNEFRIEMHAVSI